MQETKCIILLSSKSSGSSALQRLFSGVKSINTVATTRHNQQETLYWTKAASVLERPQVDMLDSEVPIEKSQAEIELRDFLRENTGQSFSDHCREKLVFRGWAALCEARGPIFFEKSPHHLHQWSALELIVEMTERFPEIPHYLIGLVRNPIATIYSRWRNDRTIPELYQYEWLQAYENLRELKARLGDTLQIVKYEDIVTQRADFSRIFEFIGCNIPPADMNYMHAKSVSKWQRDRSFGFVLDERVKELGRHFGYENHDMDNHERAIWPVARSVSRFKWRIRGALRAIKNS